MDDYESTAEDRTESPAAEAQEHGERPDSEKARVMEWLDKIAHAERLYRPAFKRMRDCMDLVAFGGSKQWTDAEKYVVPVIARHINLAVAQLYAKDPRVVVKRKERMLYTVWDGRPDTIAQAKLAADAALVDPMADPVGAEMARMNFDAIMQDVTAAAEYNLMADRTAKTLQLLWAHFMAEQTLGTKKQLKALVRRTKTTGVGYVKLGFQRQYEPSPEMDSRIQDITQQIANAQQLQREVDRGDVQEDSPEVEELRSTLEALQKQVPLAREGLVLSYPRSTRVIIDPACDNLTTLSGSKWLAEMFLLTCREIEAIYGVKVDGSKAKAMAAFEMESDKSRRKGALRVYEVQDKETGTFFTICEGHDGYLKRPDLPPVLLERFFNVFTLVFNDVEHETELFPASDVWRARHMQDEYNRSREGRREHRVAARPYYVSQKGMLEDEDKDRLAGHAAHEIVELNSLPDGQSVDKVLQRGPVANIDPNLYEVETINTDFLRTVGSQEANLGGLSGATATESSIAESSRVSSIADNVDDLDELLSDLARNGGQVLLHEMSKQTVLEIVGPGAVWPDAPPSRKELADELMLSIKAGSSGRPNKAAEIANIERAVPFLVQTPGINPKPLVEKYADLLDIDIDELYLEGALSIVAQNQIVGSAAPPAGGNGSAPAAQGNQGGSRPQGEVADAPQRAEGAFPQPGEAVAAPA